MDNTSVSPAHLVLTKLPALLPLPPIAFISNMFSQVLGNFLGIRSARASPVVSIGRDSSQAGSLFQNISSEKEKKKSSNLLLPHHIITSDQRRSNYALKRDPAWLESLLIDTTGGALSDLIPRKLSSTWLNILLIKAIVPDELVRQMCCPSLNPSEFC